MKRLAGLYLPKLSFALTLLVGLAVAVTVFVAEGRRQMAQFERSADLAIDRVVTRLRQHVVLLRSVLGLFEALDGQVSRSDFVRFLNPVDIGNALSGVQGVGFARMVATADSDMAAQSITAEYGFKVEVRPETDQPWRTPIILLEPASARNQAALGFDMYSDATRRLAMDQAIVTSQPQMSGPVELVQEITPDKQAGFLIYLPYWAAVATPGDSSSHPAGFVYAPFRAADLINAALGEGPALSVALRITDTGDKGGLLYDGASAQAASSGRELHRARVMMGRPWAFEVTEIGAAPVLLRYPGTVLVTLASLFLAAATALAISARQEEAARAMRAAAASAREAEHRGLLLQEMKHRIKNHITRIQSYARQSARGASDLKGFIDSFDARLRSMAAAQDLLAGTAIPQTDLRSVLMSEFQQFVEGDDIPVTIDGPEVRLNETQAHAFALVVHELVTNALKYGGLSAEGRGLAVNWSLQATGPRDQADVVLDWRETTEPTAERAESPSPGGGFGLKLIEASLRGDLSGKIERTLADDGLHVRLSFPVTVPNRRARTS